MVSIIILLLSGVSNKISASFNNNHNLWWLLCDVGRVYCGGNVGNEFVEIANLVRLLLSLKIV